MPTIDTTLESPLEKLKHKAETQLKNIKTQQKHIKGFQSNVDVLMKRYQIDESLFGKVANFYGSLNIWWRLLLGLTVIALSAYIGVIVSAPLFTISITMCVYGFTTYLLWDHAANSKKRNERISKDIVNLEQSVSDTLLQLSTIEDNLKSVLTSLHSLNVKQANDLIEFEKKLKQFQLELDAIHKVSVSLEDTQNKLSQSEASLSETLSEAHQSINETQHEVHHVHKLASDIEGLTEQMVKDKNTTLERLPSLIERFKILIGVLQEKLTEECVLDYTASDDIENQSQLTMTTLSEIKDLVKNASLKINQDLSEATSIQTPRQDNSLLIQRARELLRKKAEKETVPLM